MHVGINAQLLSFSQNYRNGGISRHIRSLLMALTRWPGEHEYTVFVNGEGVIERLAMDHPQISYVAAPWPESQPAARIAWEQLKLPRLVRERRIDVLHALANVLPERLPGGCAGVVTLHDLAFLRFPQVLTRAKRLYHRIFTLRSLRRATRIITVSESTRQDAIELASIPAGRLHTVYPSLDERFTDTAGAEGMDTHPTSSAETVGAIHRPLETVEGEFIGTSEIQSFRQKHGLTGNFLLYLGTLEPRKNIVTLIEAYARLRSTYGIQEKLVLAGGKGWLYESIFERLEQLGLAEEVLFAGFVADEEQKLWYSTASAFVYPSLYEGFGLPVIEALACGTPVVTSNVSSLPEAGAGIALCIDPYDVEALAQALYKALTDQAYRQHCRTMAPLVARRFSAQAMAEQTIGVYEQAVGLHDSPRNRQGQGQRLSSHSPAIHRGATQRPRDTSGGYKRT